MTYPDRYVITGTVKEGEHQGEKVWLRWSEEGGGWWMWGPEGWAHRFDAPEGARFEDAMRCATGQTWTNSTVGPWNYAADISTVKVEPTTAIVTVS